MIRSTSRAKRSYDPAGTRARILDTASAEFQKGGYHATSMHDIMRRAAVPGGSVYHYFPTKKGLGLAVIRERVAEDIAQTWIAPMRGASSASNGVVAVFDSVARDIESKGFVQGCPLNNLVLELSLADADFQRALRSVFDAWQKAVAERFSDDLRAGIVRSVNPKRLAILVVALFSGAMSLAKAAQGAAPVRACRREIAALLP